MELFYSYNPLIAIYIDNFVDTFDCEVYSYSLGEQGIYESRYKFT
jgi:hypothetical protein